MELGEPTRIEIDRGQISKIAGWAPNSASELGHPDLILAPALSDLHVHLMAAASARRSLDLSTGAPHSLPELFRVLRGHAEGLPPDTWLRAHGFDEFHLEEGRPPTAQELAAALPGRRVRLRHATLHASVLSVAGLKAVEETIALSPDEARGFLVGREEELTTLCGAVDPSVRGEGLAELGAELVRGGIACVDDLTATNDANRVAVLAEAVREGKIPQRP